MLDLQYLKGFAFFDNLNFTDYFTDFSFFKKDEINQLFTTTDIETLRNLLDSFLIKRFCNNENEIVKNAVENLIGLDEIRGISLNGDYNFTDTTTKEYRYQAVFDIGHY